MDEASNSHGATACSVSLVVWGSTTRVTRWRWVCNVIARPLGGGGNDIGEVRCVSNRENFNPRAIVGIARIALCLARLDDLKAGDGRKLPAICTGATGERGTQEIEGIIREYGTV